MRSRNAHAQASVSYRCCQIVRKPRSSCKPHSVESLRPPIPALTPPAMERSSIARESSESGAITAAPDRGGNPSPSAAAARIRSSRPQMREAGSERQRSMRSRTSTRTAAQSPDHRAPIRVVTLKDSSGAVTVSGASHSAHAAPPTGLTRSERWSSSSAGPTNRMPQSSLSPAAGGAKRNASSATLSVIAAPTSSTISELYHQSSPVARSSTSRS